MVVHSSQGSLYEEPLIACLAVSLERITDLHVPAAASAAAAARAAATEPPASPVAGQPASRALGQSTATRASRAPSSPGSARGPRGVFGRLLGSGRAGGRGLPRSTSISSVVSDDMLAGEDAGDECEPACLLRLLPLPANNSAACFAGCAEEAATMRPSTITIRHHRPCAPCVPQTTV